MCKIFFFVNKVYLFSASKKVLNSGLGPFKDQTAEMVLFWFFYYTKVLFFPIMIIMLCSPVPGTMRQLASNCRVEVID